MFEKNSFYTNIQIMPNEKLNVSLEFRDDIQEYLYIFI